MASKREQQLQAEIDALKAKLASKGGPLTITEAEYKGSKTLTYSGPFFKRIGVRGNAQLIVHAEEAMEASPALAEAVADIRKALKAS